MINSYVHRYRRALHPRKLAVIAVLIRDKFVCARISMRYRSNRPVCMGPHPCVNELPPRVYDGYRRYTATDILTVPLST